LVDADHTRSDGFQANDVVVMSTSYIAGSATRFLGNMPWGQSAWVFSLDLGSTARIGLFDARHTGFGYQASYVGSVTDSGYVTGFSSRISDTGGGAGQTAWIYNALTGTIDAFDLSERNDHYAYSWINDVNEDGVAVGEYDRYTESGGYIGRRAFAWTPEKGFFDLADEFGVELPADWVLQSAQFVDESGNIAGKSSIDFGQATAAYVAQSVPEPSTALLAAVGLAAALSRWRRK
jgi:hypothetical protein